MLIFRLSIVFYFYGNIFVIYSLKSEIDKSSTLKNYFVKIKSYPLLESQVNVYNLFYGHNNSSSPK